MAEEKRVALVIGNARYEYIKGLSNPGNDAHDVSEKLSELGFDVICEYDLRSKNIEVTLQKFQNALNQSDTALLYYAGHGIQFQGKNYLLPVDAEIDTNEKANVSASDQLKHQAILLDKLLELMTNRAAVNLVFLDACRENPFPKSLIRSMGRDSTRSIGTRRGLAGVERIAGTFIVYATDPDDVAYDGEGQRNSPFTSAFLEFVAAPDIKIEDMMKHVRKKVRLETNGEQRPWDLSSLQDDFYFAGHVNRSAQLQSGYTISQILSKKHILRPKKATNDPKNILSAWTALEVFSPPMSITGGADKNKNNDVKDLRNNDEFPWEIARKKKFKDFDENITHYQIVLGTIDLKKTFSELFKIYLDDSQEARRSVSGKAPLMTIAVDKFGVPLENQAVVISSFGWALYFVLKCDLDVLAKWKNEEENLVQQLAGEIKDSTTGRARSLNIKDAREAYVWLIQTLKLPDELICSHYHITEHRQKNEEKPEPLIHNSYYLEDLSAVQLMLGRGSTTDNLKRYLGVLKLNARKNLMTDEVARANALEPSKFPLSSLPGKGRNSLVTLQQSAVNLVSSSLQDGGMLAVNGPPGTGKTTLLRDIIADIITQRAEVMTTFSDPSNAFGVTGEEVEFATKKSGALKYDIYELNDNLKGFEVIVASSNNKAVENISAELPGVGAIDKEAKLRYFKSTSDNILQNNSWGLIAAILGNKDNRKVFKEGFWWDREYGLQTYLGQVGYPPQVTTIKTKNGEIEKIPEVVTKEDPPSSHNDAKSRWKIACKEFQRKKLQVMERLERISRLRKDLTKIKLTHCELSEDLDVISSGLRKLHSKTIFLNIKTKKSLLSSTHLYKKRPAFFHRLFKTGGFRSWKNTCDFLDTFADKENKLNLQNEQYEEIKDKILGQFIDESFFNLPDCEQQEINPWLDKETARLRQDLFESAMAVHKAFIDAAAKPVKHNLRIFVEDFCTRSLGSEEKDKFIDDLWATFFLVIPVVSTTFASMGRMFNKINAEKLGWLLIDEAAQAAPQEAIGGIMRTRKAVVVGDPLQIEPITTLPQSLTETICHQYGVAPSHYSAPIASAQTLADRATQYFGSFGTQDGQREVGVPLLVHRRCDDPMFRISNAIAYDNLMVQNKEKEESNIGKILGPSQWFHVESGIQREDRWSPEEGAALLDLLKRLAEADCELDLYIITPFKDVRDNLCKLLLNSRVLVGRVLDPASWVNEYVCTVHSVQGREAEAVILMLGAPDETNKHARARYWAGKSPNLLNVAVTRAKERLYVVGNQMSWKNTGSFQKLYQYLL